MQQRRLGIGPIAASWANPVSQAFLGARPSAKIIAGPCGFLLTGVTVTCSYMDMETAKAYRSNHAA